MKKETEAAVDMFIVYPEAVNRTPAGIHERKVVFKDDLAFVYHADSRVADIVPATNVFKDIKAAKLYFAGQGKVLWVVMIRGPRYKHETPAMFQGRVSFRVNTNRHAHSRFETLVKTLDGKLVENIPYDAKFFETKRKAESHFTWLWRQSYNQAKKERGAWEDFIRALVKNRPRSRK